MRPDLIEDSRSRPDPPASPPGAHPAAKPSAPTARARALLARAYAYAYLVKGKLALFLFNFGLGKAAAFAGPLLLASLLGPDRYGQIELAWSIALLAAALLGVGVPLAVPLLTMVRRPRPTEDLVAGSVALPGAAMLLGGAGVAWAGYPAAALVFFCITLGLAQASLGSYLRVFSYRNTASWADGFATHSIVLVVLALIAVGDPTIRNIAGGAGIAALLVVVCAALIMVRWREPFAAERLRAAIAAGMPLLIYSLCSMWAIVSPRILLGAALTARDVGLYALCFRIAAGIFFIHSALAIGLFAKAYRMHTRQYDAYLAAYTGALAAISVVLIAVFPFLIQDLGLGRIGAALQPQVIALFPIVMLQVFGSSVWAWAELRLNRARRSRQAAGPTLLLFAAFALIIGALAWGGLASARTITWLCAVQVFCGMAVQFYVLWRRGMKMPRTMVAIALASAVILAAGWIAAGSLSIN